VIESLLVADGVMSTSEEQIKKVLQERPDYPREIERLLKSFSRWCQSHGGGLKLLQTEVPVHSLQYGYAGTVDAVARKIDGSRGLVMLEWSGFSSLFLHYQSFYVFSQHSTK